jgi:hypothetical protein
MACPHEIEQEIRRIIIAGKNGQLISTIRAEQLMREYPDDYDRIHFEITEDYTAALNPLYKKKEWNTK